MSWDENCDSLCPVARSLLMVGDRWTMLILRELAMGMHRFDELQAQTGMSSHLLTLRLKRMQQDGVIERRQYLERPPRYEYHTTKMGKDLDPLLMMLRTWGRTWLRDLPEGEPAVKLVHKASGVELDDLWQIPGGGRDFTFDDCDATIGPAYAAERERRRVAFQNGTPMAKARKDGAKAKAALTAVAAPKRKTAIKTAKPASETPPTAQVAAVKTKPAKVTTVKTKKASVPAAAAGRARRAA
ncbi:helix-turn-helix domain-containing protein [Rugamonas sp.]|uniref:winged helix-turn-helix transcriptional regulator n=1 Tax=Rugamonas sp. TaxID=1926287 RepID=UPI0025DFEE7C|nr:helix-turn-helix domain-containing protein [Rugamonas sp.]